MFSLERIHAHQIAAVGAPVGVTAWHYPPTFLLAVMPLGWLPYPLALILWLVLPVAAFWLVLKRLYGDTAAAASLLLFPGVALCLVSGQNGVITAALLGAALLHLDERPLRAGILFGLLTYKPHLAALVFPALIVGGHWRALAAVASATAAAMVLASVAVLGVGAWTAFVGNLDFLTRVLDFGAVPWVRMPTVYAAARLFELNIVTARLLQTLASRGNGRHGLRDLVPAGALGVAWIGPGAGPAARNAVLLRLRPGGADPADRLAVPVDDAGEGAAVDLALLTLAWFSPALFWVIAMAGGPPLMPLVLVALIVLVWRHAFAAMPATAGRPPGLRGTPRCRPWPASWTGSVRSALCWSSSSLPVSLFYLAAGLYVTSGLDPLIIHDETTHISGDDFVTFWAAARFAIDGVPTWAYDPARLYAAEIAVTGPLTKFTAWHYPPTFMLAVIPLGLVRFPCRLVLLAADPACRAGLADAGAVPHADVLVDPAAVSQRRAVRCQRTERLSDGAPDRRDAVPPGAPARRRGCAVRIADLEAASGRACVRRPDRGRTLARACRRRAPAALALVAASIAVLGLAPWYAFLTNFGYVTQLLDTGSLPWQRMPSVYVSARLIGFDIATARVVQVVVAAAALAVVATIWYRGAALAWRGTALIAAVPLVTPYVFDYDLVVLVLRRGVAAAGHACAMAGSPATRPSLSPLDRAGAVVAADQARRAALHAARVRWPCSFVAWRRAFPLGVPTQMQIRGAV